MKKNLILFLITLLCIQGYSQITYVKQDAIGTNDGSNWENAFTDLDYAIEYIAAGEIWVAMGTYKPTTDLAGLTPSDETLKTFRIKPSIALYGGFLGNEVELAQRDWVNNPTILSGDIGVEGDLTDNVRHVLSSISTNLNINTIIDGFTIRDGYAYWQYNGGGIYVNQAYQTEFILRNNILENNYAFGDGGGMYIFRAKAIVENNIFRNNQALRGGAIYLSYSNATVSNNEIIDNIAGPFSTISSTSMSGGGIYISAYSSPTIDTNIIKGNYAEYEGGGVTIDNNYHTVFKNNYVLENASDNGGGLMLNNSKTFFFNNIFGQNHADENGGGVYMDYVNFPEFINNTVVDNDANQKGGGLFLVSSQINLVNSIVYYNQSPQGSQIAFYANWTPKFRYSNIQYGQTGLYATGNPYIYENNIDAPPLFVNRIESDYRLLEQSSCINSGTIAADIIASPWSGSNGEVVVFTTNDIDGNSRIIETIDLGAYEFDHALNISGIEANFIPIYPNPTSGKLYFREDLSYDSISIFDLGGRKLNITNDSSRSYVDLLNFNNGIYLVVIEINKKKQVYKIILNK